MRASIADKAFGIMRRLNVSGLMGVAVVGSFLIVAVFAPVFAPYDPGSQDLSSRLLPPVGFGGSTAHVLGTDALGRDVLTRVVFGARSSLLIGVGGVLLAGSLGTMLGLVAGYRGGLTETLIMRLVDVQLAFPGLLMALVVLAFIGSSTPAIIVVLALNGWMIFAKVARSGVLTVRELAYVKAAEMVGAKPLRIVGLHILPNLVGSLIVVGVLEFARIMLAESALSFLGFGLQPPATSWGLDIAAGRTYLLRASWLVAFPGFALMTAVLGTNLLGDGLRRVWDPSSGGVSYSVSQILRRRRKSMVPRSAVFRGNQRTDPVPKSDRLLDVVDLRIEFPTTDLKSHIDVVRGISFVIGTGEVVGLVGESGCGKTVTAKAIAGLLEMSGGRISGGDIQLMGESTVYGAESAASAGTVALIPQDAIRALNPMESVGRHIDEILRRHTQLDVSGRRDRTYQLLTDVGIGSPARRALQFPHELSGGLAQRVMIAMALATEPKLLIADEPTTALDATVQAQILELLAALRDERNLSVLLISHDLGIVARLCDRVMTMYAGRIVEAGDVFDVFEQPAHPYTAGLLASIPQTALGRTKLKTIGGTPPDLQVHITGCSFAPRCPRVVSRCMDDDPALLTFGASDRTVACWEPLVGIRHQ